MSDSAPNNLIDEIIKIDVVEEQVERIFNEHVPYERLEIECNKPEINNERVEFLFDDKEHGVSSGSGTSKWLAPLAQNPKTKITITVKDEFEPITLTHYAFKSANDASLRDPLEWGLYMEDSVTRPPRSTLIHYQAISSSRKADFHGRW